MKLLEDMLKIKCEKEDTEILLAQWKYDKELYKDILQNTKDYYCHYTDHGIKHSETILSNVVRILGEDKIEELSSLDIWLLLESAYIHDSGMFITRSEVNELCKDKEFIKYFKCLELDVLNDLHQYTKYFKIQNEVLTIKENEYSLKAEYGLKFIIAEYNRESHAEKAKKVVGQFDKFKKENILIPKRINDIPFIISKAHSYNFEDVMEIQYVETGLKLEKGHPRFIACMLRLGDLLDMDNNRFSPTLLENIYDMIPEKSKNHIEKHKSIKHYRVDNNFIEITAKISEENLNENSKENIYDITNEVGIWFDCITTEHKNQILNWENIKPINFSGTLPMLGDLKVELEEYDFIVNKKKPKFSVDTNNILKLLQGSGIYKNREVALRELIQNSIDAIFLKVFKENREKILKEDKKENYKKLREKYLGKEKILITIEAENLNKFKIVIKDTGIGIGKNDLNYLIEAGSSPNNLKKKILVSEMPFWLRPSGNFGIGFQSVFMLTDKVEIKSKKNDLNNPIRVTMFSPSLKNKKRGNIYIQTLSNDENLDIGTEFYFSYAVKEDEEKEKKQIKEPFVEKINEERLIKEIKKIGEYSPIKIYLKINGKEEEIKIEEENNSFLHIEEEGLEIKEVKYDFGIDNKIYYRYGGVRFLYKNQLLRDSMDLEIMKFIINFLSDEANEILQINRELLKEEVVSKMEFTQRVFNSIFKYLKVKYESNFDKLDSNLKVRVSSFIYYYEKYYEKFLKYNKKYEINQKIRHYFIEDKLKDMVKFSKIKIKFDEEKYQIFQIEKKKEQEIKVEINLKVLLKYILENGCFSIELKVKDDNYMFYDYLESITLKKVDSKEDEGVITNEKIDLKNSPINLYFYTFTNDNNKKLRLNFTKILKEEFQEDHFSYSPDERGRGVVYDGLIIHPFFDRRIIPLEYLYRNIVLFPLKKVEDDKWDWDLDMKEKYLEFCFNYRYDRNLTKNDIEFEIDKYIEILKLEYNIIENEEEEKKQENEKKEKLLEIFPEIKLENGEVDFDKLKQLIENKN